MKRLVIFLYGIVCYAAALVTFVYAAGFWINVGVPKGIDSAREVPLGTALAIDLALLVMFGLQHSIMARPAFKRWWTRIIPASAERSTYVLFSSVALMALFAFWQPMGGVIWDTDSATIKALVYSLYALGWGVLFLCTFLINHFDLMGLRQIWLQLVGRPYTYLDFKTPLFYRYVRHPLYIGWFMISWATPRMTVAHLVYALGASVYILIAIRYEERDLVSAHPEYDQYRRKVPMLIPSLKAQASTPSSRKMETLSS
jgi:protein-S-isoprenylcysteine O-methyltransferase Ste14